MDYEKVALIEDLWVEAAPHPPPSKKLKLGMKGHQTCIVLSSPIKDLNSFLSSYHASF